MNDDTNNLVPAGDLADNYAPADPASQENPTVLPDESAPVLEPQPAEAAPQEPAQPTELTQEPVQQTEQTPTPQEQQSPPSPEATAGQSKKSMMAGLFLKWKEKMSGRNQTRLQKIMELANKKKKIKVEDVENLLIVSRPTATRYVDQLVKNNRLKVSGKSVETEYEPL